MLKVCSIPDCSDNVYCKGLCHKHYDHKIHGYGVFKSPSKERSRTDPNEFSIEGDICIITLYDHKNRKKAETIIDAEDYPKCALIKWSSHKDDQGNDRVYSNIVGSLPSFLLGLETSSTIVIDHKNGNTLYNRKANLRICSQQQNCFNRKIAGNNSSGYKGVIWNKQTKKWISRIKINGNSIHLGTFLTREEAALAYNKKAMELFDSFAVLNEVTE